MTKNLNNSLGKLLVDFKSEARVEIDVKRLPEQILTLKRKVGVDRILPATRTVVVRNGKWFTPSGQELQPADVRKNYTDGKSSPRVFGLVKTNVPGPLKSSWPTLDRVGRDARLGPTVLKGGGRNLN